METKKVSVSLFGMRTVKTNNRISSNWPSGKLIIFDDRLKLKCILGSYEIPLNDIVNVSKAWYMPFNLVFRQKSDEDMIIYVFGFGLGKKLRELNSQFKTRLQLDY